VSGHRGARFRAWRAFDVVILVLAVALAWPAAAVRQGIWVPPASVDAVFPGGRKMTNAVQSYAGRIQTRERVLMVFRWLQEPVEVSVQAPQGRFELRLGNPAERGARLTWDGSDLTLVASGVSRIVPLADGLPDRLALWHADGRYGVRAGGRSLEPAVPGPAPPAPAMVVLEPGASVAGFACRTSTGEMREVRGQAPPSGLRAGLWALLTTLVALCWWHAWRPRARDAQAARWPSLAAGLVVVVVLLGGMPFLLERHNASRMLEQRPCEQTGFHEPDAQDVLPGRPYELGERRDGDFSLTASVVLEEGAVLDLLLRADLPKIDRQVLVTLSTDPALPSGLAVNLGTSLSMHPARPELQQLPAGRPLELTVTCRDERTEASIDGRSLGQVGDYDLRAGRTAFHALAGRALVSDLRLVPLGVPRALTGTLRTWQVGAAGALAVAFALLWWCLGGAAGAWLWAWPLASLASPLAPVGLRLPAFALAGLLLILEVLRAGRSGAGRSSASRTRRALALPAGAAVVGVCVWVHAERPAQISPMLLNAMRPADVSGTPVPVAYAWARHPLCRRFNGYLKTQTFRDEPAPIQAPAGALRVVAIGSSSTFGYGVAADEAWPAQLRTALLRRSPGREIVVVNAGVPGGTAERLRFFLEGVVLGLRPDLVVIDLGFNDHTYGGAVDERAHFEAMTTRGIGPLEAWWRRMVDGRRARSFPAFMAANQRGEASAEDIRRLLTEPAARFSDSLREMVAASRRAGADVLLVQEPMRPGEDRRNLAAYHEAMAAVARASDVVVVSPQARLDTLGEDAFVDMVHPRAVGHGVIAESVAEAVAGAGLLER
jgi:lysophospholipase L1-like esterase